MEFTISKLRELQKELDTTTTISVADKRKFNRIAERAKAIAVKEFDVNQTYSKSITKVIERISTSSSGFSSSHINSLAGILELMIDELELSHHKNKKTASSQQGGTSDNSTSLNTYAIKNDNLKVFIVHGHNDAMKLAAARTLEKLGLIPIILHEKANAGDTIIEKFTKHSDVGFSIVLLSADDYGYSKTDIPSNAKLRARQNVIFELGFFTAKLGRKRVVAIFEQVNNFEKPSDIDGVIYIPYNSSDSRWQFDLVKELLEVGYQIDANNLIR